MKRLVLALALAASCFSVRADITPVELVRSVPAIPLHPTEAQCEGNQALIQEAERVAMQDAQRAQAMYMQQMMNPGSDSISDDQAKLIERLLDPNLQMCEYREPRTPPREHYEIVNEIQMKMHDDIDANCPDVGALPEQECIAPIIERAKQEHAAALKRYHADANAYVAGFRQRVLECSAEREALLKEVEQARLPAQYLGLTMGLRNSGWERAGEVIREYGQMCRNVIGMHGMGEELAY